jgi:hypothetical protein
VDTDDPKAAALSKKLWKEHETLELYLRFLNRRMRDEVRPRGDLAEIREANREINALIDEIHSLGNRAERAGLKWVDE